MKDVKLNEISKIEYLDYKNLMGRAIPSVPYRKSNGEWIMWLPQNGGLIWIYAEPAKSCYVAKESDSPNDVYLPFFDFLFKHVYYPKLLQKIDSIIEDFHNMCTVIAKIDSYFYILRGHRKDTPTFVRTELEYLFVLCRSMLDLLQGVVAFIWKEVELKTLNVKKKNLPASFRKMVLTSEQIMSRDEIGEKYQIPDLLANFYRDSAGFFVLLRKFRDSIVHQGKSVEIVFELDKGFAVDANTEPFKSFGVWREDDFAENNLVTLRPIIHHLIRGTIDICDNFTDAIKQLVIFPPSLIPNHNMYIRGVHSLDYIKLDNIIENQRWWV